jgi:hypothetical protein
VGFLVGGMGEEVKFHLLSWYKVCSPISGGGGFGGLKFAHVNQALKEKWL